MHVIVHEPVFVTEKCPDVGSEPVVSLYGLVSETVTEIDFI